MVSPDALNRGSPSRDARSVGSIASRKTWWSSACTACIVTRMSCARTTRWLAKASSSSAGSKLASRFHSAR